MKLSRIISFAVVLAMALTLFTLLPVSAGPSQPKFDPLNGDEIYRASEAIAPADPTFRDYTFDGWYDKILGGEKCTVFETGKTYFAHYTAKDGRKVIPTGVNPTPTYYNPGYTRTGEDADLEVLKTYGITYVSDTETATVTFENILIDVAWQAAGAGENGFYFSDSSKDVKFVFKGTNDIVMQSDTAYRNDSASTGLFVSAKSTEITGDGVLNIDVKDVTNHGETYNDGSEDTFSAGSIIARGVRTQGGPLTVNMTGSLNVTVGKAYMGELPTEGKVNSGLYHAEACGIYTSGDFTVKNGNVRVVMAGAEVAVEGKPAWCYGIYLYGNQFTYEGGRVSISTLGDGSFYGDAAISTRSDKLPTADNLKNGTVTSVDETNPYQGFYTGDYHFSIVKVNDKTKAVVYEKEHAFVKVEEEGYDPYYFCDCGDYAEDENGVTPIGDIEAWKEAHKTVVPDPEGDKDNDDNGETGKKGNAGTVVLIVCLSLLLLLILLYIASYIYWRKKHKGLHILFPSYKGLDKVFGNSEKEEDKEDK